MENKTSNTCKTSTKSSRHPSLIYEINPNEIVTVVMDGEEHQYRGTIRASTAAPQGPCQWVAIKGGRYPYICVACDTLTRGQTSPLNRRVSRDSNTQTSKIRGVACNSAWCRPQVCLHFTTSSSTSEHKGCINSWSAENRSPTRIQ